MEYAVSISARSDQRRSWEADLDHLIEWLPHAAAALVEDGISVTFAIDAADLMDATAVAGRTYRRAARATGMARLTCTEMHVCEWSIHEREVAGPNLPDLVGQAEAATILGVSRQRVHQLVQQNQSFPPPLFRLTSGPVWLRTTIEAFDQTWARKPGRPRAATAG